VEEGYFEFLNEVGSEDINCQVKQEDQHFNLEGFLFHSTRQILLIIMHKSELSSSLNTLKCKIVLLGDSGVGKSSIIDRFVNGEIDHQNQVSFRTLSLLLGLISSVETWFSEVDCGLLREVVSFAVVGHCWAVEIQEFGTCLLKGR
jgi:hypothetical protein